jgi:hypothetical protein
MRSFASVLLTVCLAAASLTSTGCSGRAEEEEVLPWLRILRTESAQFGIFSGSRTQTVEARYFGFWHDVDANLAKALDADTALLYRPGGPALLHRGDRAGQPICGPRSIARVPPAGKVVDCVDVIEARGRYGASHVDYRRVSSHGAVLARGDISVENDQSSLMVATLLYDDESHPYFVAVRERDWGKGRKTTVSCSLVTWRDGEATVAARLPPQADRFGSCPDPLAWTNALGIEVHDVDHPVRQRPVSTPRRWPAS